MAIRGIGGNLGSPAWSSIMAELVPQGVGGRYFGWRGTLVNGTALVLSFVAMGIMEYSKTRDIFIGFSILFGGAMLFRLLSAVLFSRMYEPPMPRDQSTALSSVPRTGAWAYLVRIARLYLSRFQVLNFMVVGGIGYAVNLLVYWAPDYAVQGAGKIPRTVILPTTVCNFLSEQLSAQQDMDIQSLERAAVS